MSTAEADGSGLRGKVFELKTECRAVHTEVPAGLVDVVRMAKCSITLEMQLRESDRELQRILCGLWVAIGVVLEAQHLALSKSEEARSCLQQLEGVK